MENKIKEIYLISGCNRVLDSTEELNKFIDKKYDAECGSGFYSINDIEIAKSYALKAALHYGGKPYLNFFRLNYEKLIKDQVKVAFFNELNEETMEYLSHNVAGRLPEHCPLSSNKNLRPVDLCMNCKYENCKWNAEYIQAILLDTISTNLTNIFIDYYNKKIDGEELTKLVYEKLDEYTNGEFKIQSVLRGRLLNLDAGYLQFLSAVPIGQTT